jgi:hypothetical protein
MKPGMTMPGRVDHLGAAGRHVRPDGEDFLALDQHVRLRELALERAAQARIHRHHRTAANDVTPARRAGALGHCELRCRRPRREQIETRRGNSGCRRAFEEVAPRRREVSPPFSLSAQDAHVILPYPSSAATTLSHPAAAPAWSKCENAASPQTNSSQLFEWAIAHRDWGKSGIILFILSAGSAAHADYGWRTRMSVMPQHRGYDLTGHWFCRAGVL